MRFRVALLLGWLLAVAICRWGPEPPVLAWGSFSLPVFAAFFFWNAAAAFILGLLSAGLMLAQAFSSPRPELLAGPLVLLVGIVCMGWLSQRQAVRRKRELEAERASLQKRLATLDAARRHQESVRRAEGENIQQISELYGLSKELLATLDLNAAMGVTEEALAHWVPHLESSTRQRVLSEVRRLVERGNFSLESLVRVLPLAGTDVQGRERWGVVSGQLALGLTRVSLYRRVQELATHDHLTGLWVRRHFRERLREELARAVRQKWPLAFLMVDLDHFKRVNDTYGHLVGDRVLKEVAHRIQSSVREMDLVGRYGGEEFAVGLPGGDRALSVRIADRIRKAVEAEPVRAYDETVTITVSVGVSLCPDGRCDDGQLIDEADAQMYRAKAAGRNRTMVADGGEAQ